MTGGGIVTMPPILFMAIKHFLQFSDFTLDEFEYVIERTRLIKRKFKNYEPHHSLIDRTLVMCSASARCSLATSAASTGSSLCRFSESAIAECESNGTTNHASVGPVREANPMWKYGDFAFNREVRTRWGLKRLFLHARRIDFPHPEHRRKMSVEAALPSDLADVLKRAAIEP